MRQREKKGRVEIRKKRINDKKSKHTKKRR